MLREGDLTASTSYGMESTPKVVAKKATSYIQIPLPITPCLYPRKMGV